MIGWVLGYLSTPCAVCRWVDSQSGCLCWYPASLAWAGPVDEGASLAQRLATREEVLEGQRDRAEAKLREQALLAYRLDTRASELGFVERPKSPM